MTLFLLFYMYLYLRDNEQLAEIIAQVFGKRTIAIQNEIRKNTAQFEFIRIRFSFRLARNPILVYDRTLLYVRRSTSDWAFYHIDWKVPVVFVLCFDLTEVSITQFVSTTISITVYDCIRFMYSDCIWQSFILLLSDSSFLLLKSRIIQNERFIKQRACLKSFTIIFFELNHTFLYILIELVFNFQYKNIYALM